MEIYLTQEDYKKAEENGVNYANAYARFYIYGWSVEDTINIPVKTREKALWPRYKDLATENGISQARFYQRVSSGMTFKKAATTPLQKEGFKGKRVITQELIDLAASNGIKESTLRARIYMLHWNHEKASTTPIKTQHRKKVKQ